ncbi:FecR domain-containing protein [Novosphingobium sp. BL-8A]|uniref:FecR family protein n=1 Tax=Novosphingobium sp. BL-8A TaxID=3127639 RepID=UPI00375630AA
MTYPDKEDIQAQAIAWHLRLDDENDAAWDEFAAWLAADPRHNAAYEAVHDADLALNPAIAVARQDSLARALLSDAAAARQGGAAEKRSGTYVIEPRASPRRRWMWPAMAASVALAAAGTWVIMAGVGQQYSIVTAPGETRSVALADGSRIMLNGGTELVLRKSDPRVAELRSGEAQFSVHHDAGRPFTLTVGSQRVVDVGTVFNVRSSTMGLQVEVAEGAVRYEDGTIRLRLNAGDTLRASGDRLVEDRRPPSDIGAWTRGKLVYRDAPLVEVVGDITRARGIAIELGSDLSQRKFTGVIQLDGDNAALRRRVEALIGAKVAETGDGWSITR